MEQSTKATFAMGSAKALASKFGRMVLVMKVSGPRIRPMVMADSATLTEMYTTVTGKMIRQMVTEFTCT